MTKDLCSVEANKLCNCKKDLCSCVFGNCNQTIELTEENGCLVDYNALYRGITKNGGEIVGHRVFNKNGSFEGLLTGTEGHRTLRYVEEVSMFEESV